MRRREFITLAGGAAAAWPLAARAQQGEHVRRIGALIGGAAENDPESRARVAALREGLAQRGWIENRGLPALAVDDFQHGSAAPGAPVAATKFLDEAKQRCAGNILHAQEPKVAFRVHDLRKDPDDVVVLEDGQRAGFGSAIRGDFQGDLAAQGNLPSEVYFGERSLAEQ